MGYVGGGSEAVRPPWPRSPLIGWTIQCIVLHNITRDPADGDLRGALGCGVVGGVHVGGACDAPAGPGGFLTGLEG